MGNSRDLFSGSFSRSHNGDAGAVAELIACAGRCRAAAAVDPDDALVDAVGAIASLDVPVADPKGRTAWKSNRTGRRNDKSDQGFEYC